MKIYKYIKTKNSIEFIKYTNKDGVFSLTRYVEKENGNLYKFKKYIEENNKIKLKIVFDSYFI